MLDASAPDLEGHRSTVLQVLQQIGVTQEKINNMIEVWNKVPIGTSFLLAIEIGLLVCVCIYDVLSVENFRLILWMRMLHLMGLRMRYS